MEEFRVLGQVQMDGRAMLNIRLMHACNAHTELVASDTHTHRHTGTQAHARPPCRTWPYSMIQHARNRPVSGRDQPSPDTVSRRKKGRGTSNHRSREAKRKNLPGGRGGRGGQVRGGRRQSEGWQAARDSGERA